MRQYLAHFLLLNLTLALLLSTSANAQLFGKKEQALLPGKEAFRVTAQIVGDELKLFWTIAADYYMYRDQFSIELQTPGAELGPLEFPEGLVENDPEFGEVVVYFYSAELTAPILALPPSGSELTLTIRGQGCNKPVGVCYPPQTQALVVAFDRSVELLESTKNTGFDGQTRSYWSYVSAAFLAGILLSFTPCVLPLIPILMGIIAGQKKPSKLRSGWFAVCYVAGTVVVYAIAGWVAGSTGAQLQAYFQNPWVIGFICLLLVLLAASLFGAFKIQLPNSIQTKLNTTSVNTRSASLSSFALGAISSLVVGACVSPVLIITLTAALSQGDPTLGAAVMSSLALGMGLLLIALGFGAGWLLPKTGAWMNHVQTLFGFWVLGAGIYIASFNDAVPALYLWSALLLWNGFYLWQIASQIGRPLTQSLCRATAGAMVIWGAMALVGATTGGTDILQPLTNTGTTANTNASQATNKLPFTTVTTLTETKALLDSARGAGKPVLIDFYADWCLDCKRMARTTFVEPAVHTALQGWQLIEIDVTDTNDNSEEVKRFFKVFGPPATLFIKSDGVEHADLRQYGYLKKDDFLTIVQKTKS